MTPERRGLHRNRAGQIAGIKRYWEDVRAGKRAKTQRDNGDWDIADITDMQTIWGWQIGRGYGSWRVTPHKRSM